MLQSILSLIANKEKLQCMADFLGVTTPEKFFVSGRSCCIQKILERRFQSSKRLVAKFHEGGER